MGLANLLRSIDLSSDFLADAVAERIRVNIDGTSITRNGTGQLQAVAVPEGVLTPIYEWRDLWAEENGGLSAGTEEYSFGNGATGRVGLPFDSGWEIQDAYLQAETAGPTATINVINYEGGGSAVLGAFTATSGDYHETLATPIPVPDGASVGFRTGNINGTWTDVRVGLRLRRLIGNVRVVV